MEGKIIKMDLKLDNTQTSLNISENVIATIVSEAIREVNGVYSLSPLPQTGFLGIQTSARPTKISLVSESVYIDVAFIINLNYKIREVAQRVQAVIKDAVQDMTGMTVSKVNVFVTGVHLKAPEK